MKPEHIAIIMDGNGRWAEARGRERIFGHIKGAQRAREIITECARREISYLTLFAFSTENWSRPRAEVNFLMSLLHRYILREHNLLLKNNIRFVCIGDTEKIPAELTRLLKNTMDQTASNQGMTLILAVNYSGQQDLVFAMREIGEKIDKGLLNPKDIDLNTVSAHLQTKHIPDPDLLIRTSGELRVSNFMLWQCAYSEFYFTPTLWPDFSSKDLELALVEFGSRMRRFGGLTKIREQEPLPGKSSKTGIDLHIADSAT